MSEPRKHINLGRDDVSEFFDHLNILPEQHPESSGKSIPVRDLCLPSQMREKFPEKNIKMVLGTSKGGG